MLLVERTFGIVGGLSTPQPFALGSQILRAAVSITANIAEGQRRPHCAYLNHLSIASGSQAELQTHLEILGRLEPAPRMQLEAALKLGDSVGQMLHALARSLRASNPNTSP